MCPERHIARRRHLRLCAEDVWGECPASPQWHCVPLHGEGYDVAARARLLASEAGLAGWRRSPLLAVAWSLRGTLGALAYPQLTDLLLGMALERSNGEVASWCADCWAPGDPRRHLGLMADRLELSASAGSPDFALRISLLGMREQANPDLAEDQFSYAGVGYVPFRLTHSTVCLDAVELADVRELRLLVDNRLAEGPSRPYGPAYIATGRRTVTAQLVLADDAALREAQRAGATCALSVDAVHPAGHSLTLDLPCALPAEVEDRTPPDAVARTRWTLEAGSDAGGSDLTYELTLT